MKTLLTLFITVLISGSALGADALDKIVTRSLPSIRGVSGPQTNELYALVAGAEPGITARDLLVAYTSKDAKLIRFVLAWLNKDGIGTAVGAALEKIAADAIKAKDVNAPIYTRAVEKFSQQLKDTSVRQDSQEAVTAALKLLSPPAK